MSHTKGPWRVDLGIEGYVAGIYAGRERIVETDDGFYPPKIEDARLISVAPDLYEAAKLLETLMTQFRDDFRMEAKDFAVDLLATEMVEKFRKAIARAEGK